MTSTSTNYGWTLPTSSDLVKNGATAISTVGQSVDTFLFRPFTRNGVLNSGMNVWQRGTSVAITASSSVAYQADRWQGYRGAAGATVSRQVTGDTTNLPNIQYCARVQRDSGNTSTSAISISQNFESVNSIPYAGKTVTISFYARAGANYSSASSALTYSLYSGTGTDQNLNGGFTGLVTVISQIATLTTTWQRFTYSATVGATATQLAPQFVYTPVGTAGANDYFEVTGVMLEVGNQASPYAPATSTYATELAACQRYLPKLTFATETFGFAYSTTGTQFYGYFTTTPRTAPTGITVSAASDFTVYNQSFSSGAATAIAFNNASQNSFSLTVTTTAGTPLIAAGQPAKIQATGANASILWTGCEL